MNILQRLFPSKATNARIPTNSLHDVRVIIPESISGGHRDGYLDLDLTPLDLEEVQRTGLFLLEHLAAALDSYNELQKLTRTYESERTSHRMTRRELESLNSGYTELVEERDSLKGRWRTATIELKQLQEHIVQLREQIAGLKDAANYDKAYAQSLEQQVEQERMDRAVRDEYDW